MFTVLFTADPHSEYRQTLASPFEEFWGVTAMRGWNGWWWYGGTIKQDGVPKVVTGKLNSVLSSEYSRLISPATSDPPYYQMDRMSGDYNLDKRIMYGILLPRDINRNLLE